MPDWNLRKSVATRTGLGDLGDWENSTGRAFRIVSGAHAPRTPPVSPSPSPPVSCERRARRRELDPSGASETDGDLAPLDDDRHLPAAGEAHHPVELIFVRQDVDIGERDFSFRVILTGRGCMGSRVFSEDLDAVGLHRGTLLPSIITCRML
jgi:hypothetical protein